MDNNELTKKHALMAMQHQTMRVSAVASLSYHHDGMVRHFKAREESGFIPNTTGLICEAIAYLNWVKRIWHYYHSVKEAEPSLASAQLEHELERLVKWFANKWSSHRAVDYPRRSDTTELKLYATQLDTCIMYDHRDGPFFSVVDDRGNSLDWFPMKEHAKLAQQVRAFIDTVASFQRSRKP
jgi:hypothetical protein